MPAKPEQKWLDIKFNAIRSDIQTEI